MTPAAETTLTTPDDVTITAVMELERADQETDTTETIQTELQQIKMLCQQLQQSHEMYMFEINEVGRTESMQDTNKLLLLQDNYNDLDKHVEWLKKS